MGYVMVSRALLQEICEKKGAACCEEEAFLRVLTNVNFKPAVVFCNGAGVQCARGESVITFMGWADPKASSKDLVPAINLLPLILSKYSIEACIDSFFASGTASSTALI